MNSDNLRERLYDYIRIADEKKVKAIYTMLEDTITGELEWWNDKTILDEFQNRYEDWDSGKTRGYTMSEIYEEISRLKKKKNSK